MQALQSANQIDTSYGGFKRDKLVIFTLYCGVFQEASNDFYFFNVEQIYKLLLWNQGTLTDQIQMSTRSQAKVLCGYSVFRSCSGLVLDFALCISALASDKLVHCKVVTCFQAIY